METAKAKEWAERLSAAQASGKSMSDVAREHNVSLQLVHKWSRRLRQPAKNKAPNGFVRLERSATQKSPRGLTLEIGNARIRIERAEDIPLATALVRALGVAK